MPAPDFRLSQKKIFSFWIPLAATWLMMAVEGPFLAAIIARLPQPKFNLAAFGVAFAFALLIEAPIIMIMSASTALVDNRQAFLKLRRFTNSLNFGITVIMIIGLIPPIFYVITEDWIGLPRHLARITHLTTLLFILWPGSIGVRRFYQGILIKNNQTRKVAHGTVIRISSMSLTALILYFFFDLGGAYIGAIAASTGVLCEAVACRIMSRKIVNCLIEEKIVTPAKPLTYRFIIKFYLPLALTSVLALGVHPMVTFFLGKSRFPIESLAVLPVVNSLVFLFRSLGLSFQEVVITLIGKHKEHYKELRNFALLLSLGVIGILGFIAFSPLLKIWFGPVSGLSNELSRFAYLPTQLLFILPGLTVWISFQRGILVNTKTTAPIIRATALEVLFIILTLILTIYQLNFIGVVAAASAYIIGRLVANFYLLPYQRLKVV
jgi:Na+-driven multidrug efflux pump